MRYQREEEDKTYNLLPRRNLEDIPEVHCNPDCDQNTPNEFTFPCGCQNISYLGYSVVKSTDLTALLEDVTQVTDDPDGD